MNPKRIFFKFHPFLFIALLLIMSFFLWQSSQQKTKPQTETVNEKMNPAITETDVMDYHLLGSYCLEEECLLQNKRDDFELVGLSTISGYYTTVTKTGYGKEEECPSLVVTGGSSKTIDFFVDRAKSGGFYTLDQDNQPIISLFPMSNLSESDKQKIFNSTEKQPVEIVVFFNKPAGMGAPVCYSPANVLKIKS